MTTARNEDTKKCQEKQQRRAPGTSASSQRAAAHQRIEKCIPLLRSASRGGRSRSETAGRAFLAEAEGAPTQASPAPPGPVPASPQAEPPQAGPQTRPAGARPPPAARTAAHAALPTAAHPRLPATPEPGGPRSCLAGRAPPAPGSSPVTEKDRSTTSTAMVPRRCSSAGLRGTGQRDASDQRSTGGRSAPARPGSQSPPCRRLRGDGRRRLHQSLATPRNVAWETSA